MTVNKGLIGIIGVFLVVLVGQFIWCGSSIVKAKEGQRRMAEESGVLAEMAFSELARQEMEKLMTGAECRIGRGGSRSGEEINFKNTIYFDRSTSDEKIESVVGDLQLLAVRLTSRPDIAEWRSSEEYARDCKFAMERSENGRVHLRMNIHQRR